MIIESLVLLLLQLDCSTTKSVIIIDKHLWGEKLFHIIDCEVKQQVNDEFS